MIESALVYQNDANFELAVDCFEKAKSDWVEILKANNGKTLRKEQELLFLLSIGSVYESCGKDDLALNYYLKAK